MPEPITSPRLSALLLVALAWAPAGCERREAPAASTPSVQISEQTPAPVELPDAASVTEWFESMSTGVRVTVPAGARVAERVALVRAVFARVQEGMNEWRPQSALGRVNAAAGGEAVAVDAELLALVERGIALGKLTDGAFDITWAALWGLWDFRASEPVPPTNAEIAARLPLIDFRKVEMDRKAGTVRLPVAGMKIGLGGIAKGYALDRAAAALRRDGTGRFLLLAGGQVVVESGHGRPFRVGVREPRGRADEHFAVVAISRGSVSTSGDYERTFRYGGKRYHHILDPRTGRPSRGARSVTVVAQDATFADAISTALMVLGPVRGLALIEKQAGVEALIVDAEGKVRLSSGMRRHLIALRPPRP